MAGSYSGVPSAGVQYGTAIQTGTGGTSNVDDYSVPVYGRNADGAYYRLPAGMTIPAGATISLASPPSSSATGGNSVTGYGIVDQAETNRHNVATETNATNATANNAAANQNNYNATMAGVQQSAQASAQRHEEAMQQLAATMAQNAAQYALDTQRFGLDQAKFNYQQGVDKAQQAFLAAQFGMSISQFNLSKEQFNAQQRQALASAKLEIDKLMASKKGPEDWVAYNNLLNGMSRPTPTGETVIDPYAGLSDLYQPSTAQAPAMPDLSIPSTPSNITPAPFPSSTNLLSGSSSTSSSSGGSGFTAPAYVQPQTVQPFGGTGLTPQAAVQTQTEQPNRHVAAPVAPVAPVSNVRQVATPFSTGAYNTGTVNNAQQSQDQSGNVWEDNGTPGGVWHDRVGHRSTDGGVTWLAQGGTTSSAAVVGDSKSGKSTGHEEIAYAATNPKTGVSELHVIPHARIASLLDSAMGRHNGTVIGAHKMPPNLLEGLPRAATGGTFGGGTQYDPLTNEPVGGESTAGGNVGYKPGLAGPTGIMASPTPMYGGAGGASHEPPMTLQPVSAPGTMVNSTTQPAMGGGSVPATGTSSPAAQPAQGTGLSSGNIAATSGNGVASGTGLTANLLAGPNPATAPATSTGYVPDPAGTYGSSMGQPYNVLRTYAPQDLGNQPFLRKLSGDMEGRPFGGFGATIQNPKLGISDFNPLISRQRYNMLQPTEQAQLKSLIEQGLGLDFGDILNMADQSAPLPANRGIGRGIQVSQYGR